MAFQEIFAEGNILTVPHRFLLGFAGPSFCKHKHGDGMGHCISYAIAPRPGDRAWLDWHSLLHPLETCSALLITYFPDFFMAHKTLRIFCSVIHVETSWQRMTKRTVMNTFFFLSFKSQILQKYHADDKTSYFYQHDPIWPPELSE